jgi:transposase
MPSSDGPRGGVSLHRVAGQDQGSRRPSLSRTTLPATGHAAVLRQQARRELLAESRQHAITVKLRQIPSLGPIRSALAVALLQTPHRFRTKRQLWAYSGLALEPRTSAEYCYFKGGLRHSKKQISIRGLNKTTIMI